MLREDPDRPHRTTVLAVRNSIRQCQECPMEEQIADLSTLDKAHEEHIKAKVTFSTINSDNTMINLIGTWARMTRIIRDMDDKYGRRE